MNVAHLQPGMALARTVWNERGDLLISPGTPLTEPRIAKLRDLGFLSAYVADGDASDEIAVREAVEEQTRRGAANRVREMYASVAGREEGAALAQGRSGRTILQCANEAGQFLSGVLGSVTGILNEVLAGDLVLGLAALKTRDHYAFEHAVDTAVMGALLAAKIRMESRELRAVVAGSLVMDLGNVVVPPTILNKHGTLSAAEHETMEQHTEAGYEIVRSMGLEDILAAHIPWQYHERQDGKGYPRGLFGNNKLARTRQQLLDGRYILQVAEVAAIANVYDALTSDRPYRDALPAAEAVETLETLAGSHLNREMVAAFISLVPVWPLGTRVRLWGQPWHGSLAVVSEQDRFDANRPVVRLIESVDGDSLDEEVRLVLHSDLELRPSSD